MAASDFTFTPQNMSWGLGGYGTGGYGGGAAPPMQGMNGFEVFNPSSVTQGLPTGAPAGRRATSSGPGWLGTAGTAIQGLQSLGNILLSFKQLKLAGEQMKFQKEFANKNYANQIASYNTALGDRGRSRAFTEGQTAAQAQAYIDQNKLKG